jgi:hypothetical protein
VGGKEVNEEERNEEMKKVKLTEKARRWCCW